ncbi:MAG: hypothetical protein PHN19_02615 [Patescibacteria group bacterium]|nr:hypothetical protein [Patescibacteria group bacterium]
MTEEKQALLKQLLEEAAETLMKNGLVIEGKDKLRIVVTFVDMTPSKTSCTGGSWIGC